jgi:hypothetical protein
MNGNLMETMEYLKSWNTFPSWENNTLVTAMPEKINFSS